MSKKQELVNWIDDAMGPDGSPEISEAVASWLIRQPEAPRFSDKNSTPWKKYLSKFDLWEIATGLGL